MRTIRVLVVVVLLVCSTYVEAVTIALVTVSNPGNFGEWSGESYGGVGPDRVCGAVDYTYNIGKYEVTATQYTEFLNAVAGVDTYELYDTHMWAIGWGCKIERFDGTGTSGDPYQYRVAPDRAYRPVNYVSWGDAARFCNWLHNGQPTGAQDLTTTEDGAYFLNGAISAAALAAVNREADWKWAISNEDEWYKAAYHKKSSGVLGNYFDYPTASYDFPSNQLISPDPGNNANFLLGDYTIGSPYYTTPMGEFENSPSPYGTFDQGGNVWEWNGTRNTNSWRNVRGGAWDSAGFFMSASSRGLFYPSDMHGGMIGFRVVQVSPPDSDGDGISDAEDQCPNTVPGTPVNAIGCPDPPIPNDYDNDGDVDQDDFNAFQACSSGPAIPLSAGCEEKDFDTDNDVDQDDFAVFQSCVSGENNPADPNCE